METESRSAGGRERPDTVTDPSRKWNESAPTGGDVRVQARTTTLPTTLSKPIA